jgi:hypothetical protein
MEGSSAERERAERALGHAVGLVLAPELPGQPLLAVSVAGDPPSVRIAWVDDDGDVLARLACPPSRPSRARPVAATSVTVELPELSDRLLVSRLAPEAAAALPQMVEAEGTEPVDAGPDGVAIARLDKFALVTGVGALDESGEPVGMLARAGIGELHLGPDGISGRLGASHGMAAGIGAGRWVDSELEAQIETGGDIAAPNWIPEGFGARRLRIEPEIAHPTAPPTVVSVWLGDERSRLLLRQAAAPLASPETAGPRTRRVDVDGFPGVIRARGMVTLVWEADALAFGLQLRGIDDPVETALRVARSVRIETGSES